MDLYRSILFLNVKSWNQPYICTESSMHSVGDVSHSKTHIKAKKDAWDQKSLGSVVEVHSS